MRRLLAFAGVELSHLQASRILKANGGFANLIFTAQDDSRSTPPEDHAMRWLAIVGRAVAHVFQTKAGTGHFHQYLIARMGNLKIEQVRCLYLAKDRRIIADLVVAQGQREQARLSTRQIFGPAIMLGASAIVMAHNHPSGRLRPSKYDIATTGDIANAAAMWGVELVDHIILSHHGSLSLREAGFL